MQDQSFPHLLPFPAFLRASASSSEAMLQLSGIVVIISLFVSVFLFLSLSFCIKLAYNSVSIPGRHIPGHPAARISYIRDPRRGVKPYVIETFPTFHYSGLNKLKLQKGTEECPICLSEFQEDETLNALPRCRHVFHVDCVHAWLVSHTTCPICRSILVPEWDSVYTETESGSDENDVVITIEEEEEEAEEEPELSEICYHTEFNI